MTQAYRDRLYANYGHDFQDAGDSFDFNKWRRWGRARAYHLRAWLPEKMDAAIIDLACGSGNLLHFFKENNYVNLTGVDISPDQVELARQVSRQFSVRGAA
jgi:SAM-dependent methyltransferase